MTIESQFETQPAADVLDALTPEERRLVIAANATIGEQLAGNVVIANAVQQVLGLVQRVWLERLNRMPDFDADPLASKREEDFHRAVAFGLDLAADHLTQAETMRDLGSRLEREKIDG